MWVWRFEEYPLLIDRDAYGGEMEVVDEAKRELRKESCGMTRLKSKLG